MAVTGAGGGKEVQVVPYDPQWPLAFAKLAEVLSGYIGDLALRIEHVGSTSVEGLAAKPILDIDVVIARYDVLPQVIDRLAKAGYIHEGNLGVEGREAFRRTDDNGFMRHHLYVCPQDGRGYLEHIALRDYLRSNAAAREAYADLKQRLAAEFRCDSKAYGERKTAFVHGILKQTLYREHGDSEMDQA